MPAVTQQRPTLADKLQAEVALRAAFQAARNTPPVTREKDKR